MDELESTGESQESGDKKTRLVVFGVLQIILGALCALLVPLMIVGSMVGKAKNPDVEMGAAQLVMGLVFYVFLAVWLIWMGIGSIKARRWARALILSSAWIWLISGTLGFVVSLFWFPAALDQTVLNQKITAQQLTVMKITMTGFVAFFGVIIPGLLVLFYSGEKVKTTVESRDTQARWTDRCPLPVLALSLMFLSGAGSMLFTACSGWVVPFFGTVLSGLAGAAVAAVVALFCLYVARGIYRLDLNSWRLALLAVVAAGVSVGITLMRVSALEMYEKMNFPSRQIEMLKPLLEKNSLFMTLPGLIWFILMLGFILYVKRYFSGKTEQAPTAD